jgi:hypothetical protein
VIYGVPNQQSRPYNYYSLVMERKNVGVGLQMLDNHG